VGNSGLPFSVLSSQSETFGLVLSAVTLSSLETHSKIRFLVAVSMDYSSVADVSERDLRASLKLLAERLQHLTEAGAASIALKDNSEMTCRASAGGMALDSGARLYADAELVKQCVRAGEIVCCNDLPKYVKAKGGSESPVGAVMVMPLLHDSEAVGVVELAAEEGGAFGDEHGLVLERVAKVVLIAWEHAEAGKNAPNIIAAAEVSENKEECAEDAGWKEAQNLRACEACGFPVSEGRKLCLDCEEARARQEGGAAPEFLAKLEREQKTGWLQAHFYTIGTVLMVLLTVVMVMLKFR